MLNLKENYILEARNISKSFGNIKALQDINIYLKYNEVLGMVGDNAAGKSTLLNILSGVYKPEKGNIYLESQEVVFKSPLDARQKKIETVFQDFGLIPELDVSTNLFLGQEYYNKKLLGIKWLDKKRMRKESLELLNDLGIKVPKVSSKAAQLSGGQQQAVAIARSIKFNPKIILLDEPTASLSEGVVHHVLNLIDNLKEKGISIILVSHRLPDIFKVTDRIIVLRHGKIKNEKLTKDTSQKEIIDMMVGDI